jgi:hypothetical protein
MRVLPCAALTPSLNAEPSLSPMYIWPMRAFSGLLAPAGSRHVPVGETGSAGPLWVVL